MGASDHSPKETKGYRIITVSLYTPEVVWLDRTTAALQRAGNPKANRSLVVREAVLRLQEVLCHKAPEEILWDFVTSHARRVTQATQSGA